VIRWPTTYVHQLAGRVRPPKCWLIAASFEAQQVMLPQGRLGTSQVQPPAPLVMPGYPRSVRSGLAGTFHQAIVSRSI